MSNWFDSLISSIGMDKVAHFFGICSFTFFFALLYKQCHMDAHSWECALGGSVIGIIIAFGKEIADVCVGKYFDFIDLLAGILGTTLAAIVVTAMM